MSVLWFSFYLNKTKRRSPPVFWSAPLTQLGFCGSSAIFAGPMHQTEEVHDIRDAGPLRTMTWWPGFSRWTAVGRVATCTVVFCILLSEARRKTETTDLMALTFSKPLRALIHRRTAWLLRPPNQRLQHPSCSPGPRKGRLRVSKCQPKSVSPLRWSSPTF